jgi:UDP-N-acetylglucosamine--dolichyl-phosphate N-acetylglucosaminephosphotransferase
MLGGFNGLEAGMGIIYTLSLGTFSFMIGNELATIIFFTAFAALLGFSRFNFAPAKILAGDSLTYVLGAIVAVGAIIGNMERAVLITMTPFIIQAILKFWSLKRMGRFASDLGVLERDGTISSKYGNKIYSWTHLIMRIGRFTETQIVAIMMGIQIVFSFLPFIGTF